MAKAVKEFLDREDDSRRGQAQNQLRQSETALRAIKRVVQIVQPFKTFKLLQRSEVRSNSNVVNSLNDNL
jgi:hypothetical protein